VYQLMVQSTQRTSLLREKRFNSVTNFKVVNIIPYLCMTNPWCITLRGFLLPNKFLINRATNLSGTVRNKIHQFDNLVKMYYLCGGPSVPLQVLWCMTNRIILRCMTKTL
jgi:hypothetical protein